MCPGSTLTVVEDNSFQFALQETAEVFSPYFSSSFVLESICRHTRPVF